MTESTCGVGRVVVLVLFTVLFVAAWRGDRVGTDRSDMRLSPGRISRRTTSIVAASAQSIGVALPCRSAARLTPAEQTNGLTLHTDRGVSAALSRIIPGLAADAVTPVVEDAIGIRLAAQFAVDQDRPAERPGRCIGTAPILSGSWLDPTELPPPAMAQCAGVSHRATIAMEEVDASGLDGTARALR